MLSEPSSASTFSALSSVAGTKLVKSGTISRKEHPKDDRFSSLLVRLSTFFCSSYRFISDGLHSSHPYGHNAMSSCRPLATAAQMMDRKLYPIPDHKMSRKKAYVGLATAHTGVNEGCSIWTETQRECKGCVLLWPFQQCYRSL